MLYSMAPPHQRNTSSEELNKEHCTMIVQRELKQCLLGNLWTLHNYWIFLDVIFRKMLGSWLYLIPITYSIYMKDSEYMYFINVQNPFSGYKMRIERN